MSVTTRLLPVAAAAALAVAVLVPGAAAAAPGPAAPPAGAAASGSTAPRSVVDGPIPAPGLVSTRNVLPGLAKATDQGPAPGNAPMHVMVTLQRPDVAGEEAALAAQQNGKAAPLSVGAFVDRFGVPARTADAAKAWLSSTGMHVVSVSAARDQIAADGPADAVSQLFATPLHGFDSPDGKFLANTADPQLPGNLGITNVVGLNTLQQMHTPHPLPQGPLQSTCLPGACTGGTTPADLWSVYEQPPTHTGSGQRVAIFGNGRTDGVISDLRAFEDRFRLGHPPVTVKHPAGDTDFSDDSGHTEWNIDTQASHGMAPGIGGMDLYFGTDLSDADVARTFSQFTDDQDSPRQASASFGECEQVPVVSGVLNNPITNPQPAPPVAQGLGNNLDTTLTAITRQAALEGKTIFSSTGDTGSSCPVASLPVVGAGNGVLNQGVPITNSPASLPYVVGVGGTVLYTDGRGGRAREYGWTHGGGGTALFTPAPAYQQGTPGLNLPCVTAPTSVCRGIPDVAAQSGDVLGNGYDIVSDGKFSDGGGGGTSLSSPLWAGMWARIQSASSAGGGLGFANFDLYRVGKDPATYARDFHDISSTDVRSGLPSTNGAYPSLPGWDYQTGWGVPRVAGLMCDVAKAC
ncbi:S53 family peptidase [Actinomycetospora endophytica]|uniref:S53 family peptidase n=1 Tax=Actinomycetospora endophytica TaxID=2291215 RepID=A0ABS8PGN4_9PSEU|nr:S53 family peptidase [Actinomycetospora endophytica]MCD2197423.1 S53 family peptidase [Actinomycetospora endophytica]